MDTLISRWEQIPRKVISSRTSWIKADGRRIHLESFLVAREILVVVEGGHRRIDVVVYEWEQKQVAGDDGPTSSILTCPPTHRPSIPFRIPHLLLEVLPISAFFSTGFDEKDEPPPAKLNKRDKLYEAALIKQWRGKRPGQIARMMVLEYFRRFPSWTLCKASALFKLILKNRNRWEDLDRGFKEAARICHLRQDEEYFYWDTMRYIAREVRPCVVKRDKEIARNLRHLTLYGQNYTSLMMVCKYCWRAAFRSFGDEWSYCHIHIDDVSKHNDKKRKQYVHKTRPYAELFLCEAFQKIWKYCKPNILLELRRVSDKSEEYITMSLKDIWTRAPHIIIQMFPNVFHYLESRNINIKSTEEIILALESPLPPNYKAFTVRKAGETIDIETNIRNLNYADFASDYGTYAPHLVWAEIWLKYEAERPRRGGARKGAGRPRKQIPETTSPSKS